MNNNFPKDFIWGTSTAAYQIEGGVNEDGRSKSVWDVFCEQEGNIIDGSSGVKACGHYHRVDEDVALLKNAGIKNYRFSISWPRILPNGIGEVNLKGIEFYSNLVDKLLENDITPWITLYHWDLPQCLQEKGGWCNRKVLDWFSEYAHVVTDALGDRVSNWIILNEPSVVSFLGHGLGFHAPGLKGEDSYLASVHYQNLVIGRMYRELKAKDNSWNVGSSYTLLDNPADASCKDNRASIYMDCFWNRNFFDPLMKGEYPKIMQDAFKSWVQDGDMELIKTDLDFIGVQHYNSIYAKDDFEKGLFGTFFGDKPKDIPTTDIGWGVMPQDFYHCLSDFNQRYGDKIPLVITENGCAYYDKPDDNGKVDDARRISFLESYISAISDAINDGVNIKGYFVWSFMDNFEWSEGYAPRFGLVYVDYNNDCKRTPKSSYYWYRDFIKG